MKNIIVPTDFSDKAEHAVHYAIRFAAAWKASLTIVHTFLPPSIPANTPAEVYKAIIKEEEKNCNSQMRHLTDRLHQSPEVKSGLLSIRQLLIKDHFVHGICQLAKEQQSDLIIMGTRGASGLKKLFIGSNTVDLLEQSSIPVLAVPAESDFTSIKQLVMALDPKQYSIPAHLGIVRDIAQAYQSAIAVLYVHEKKGSEHEQQQQHRQQLQEKLAGLAPDWHNIHGDDVEKSIHSFVQEQQAELLVMQSQRKTFWEQLFSRSLMHDIAYSPRVPLLVLP